MAAFMINLREKLYAYDSVREVKDYLRPLKHLLLGKDDIYYVVDVINRARQLSNPVRTVIDVGAATGDKTRTFLRVFPHATVYCCEPQALARQRLLKRTARWPNRVVVFPCGLYRDNRTASLRLYSYRDASFLLPLQHYMREEGKWEAGHEWVTLRKLSDLVEELGLTRIDLLKSDVEGVEKEVLEGSVKILDRVDNIFVEISPLRKGPHSNAHIGIFTLLHQGGFTFMGVYNDFWFSKDPAVLAWHFGGDDGAAK